MTRMKRPEVQEFFDVLKRRTLGYGLPVGFKSTCRELGTTMKHGAQLLNNFDDRSTSLTPMTDAWFASVLNCRRELKNRGQHVESEPTVVKNEDELEPEARQLIAEALLVESGITGIPAPPWVAHGLPFCTPWIDECLPCDPRIGFLRLLETIRDLGDDPLGCDWRDANASTTLTDILNGLAHYLAVESGHPNEPPRLSPSEHWPIALGISGDAKDLGSGFVRKWAEFHRRRALDDCRFIIETEGGSAGAFVVREGWITAVHRNPAFSEDDGLGEPDTKEVWEIRNREGGNFRWLGAARGADGPTDLRSTNPLQQRLRDSIRRAQEGIDA